MFHFQVLVARIVVLNVPLSDPVFVSGKIPVDFDRLSTVCILPSIPDYAADTAGALRLIYEVSSKIDVSWPL